MLKENEVILNRYRILNVAGKGGMGRVYHAVDIKDGSHWAIKEDLSEEYYQLHEEAEVLDGLDHPALPKTRGVHSWMGKQYMLMQYMEGITLSDMLKRQEKYTEEQVLDWFIQIADVLKYLHGREHPIVYRDLKPSNIIIDEAGIIKIIDFGIAEEYSIQESSEEMQKGGLTRGYAAPEQYSRRFKADVRTDIYALGVTIHYLLTGKNPIKPPYEFLPVRKLAPNVSLAMEDIVKQCLQPNPDQRYKTADALYYDLCHIEDKNRIIKQQRNRRIISFISSVLLVGASILFIENHLKNKREQEIDAYYAIIDQSYAASDRADFDNAYIFAQDAIAKQPKEIAGYLASAYSLVQQGEYDACLMYINENVLDQFPDCYSNTDFLGIMADLYDKQNSLQDALYYYQERCVIDEKTPEHWLDLADCQIRLNRVEAAKLSLEQYLASGGEKMLYNELIAKLES